MLLGGGGGGGAAPGGELVLDDAPLRTADAMRSAHNGGAAASCEEGGEGGDRSTAAEAEQRLVLCCEGSPPEQLVSFRDASSGAIVRQCRPARSGSTSEGLRYACVGVASGRVLLVLLGPSSFQLLGVASGTWLPGVSLGREFQATSTKVVACAIAPDDSAIAALVTTRHRATSLVVLRLDERALQPPPEVAI